MAHHAQYGVIISRWVKREALMGLSEYLTEEHCLWAVTKMTSGPFRGLYRMRRMGKLGLFEEGETLVNRGGKK